MEASFLSLAVGNVAFTRVNPDELMSLSPVLRPPPPHTSQPLPHSGPSTDVVHEAGGDSEGGAPKNSPEHQRPLLYMFVGIILSSQSYLGTVEEFNS